MRQTLWTPVMVIDLRSGSICETSLEEFLGHLNKYFFFPFKSNSWALQSVGGLVKVSVLLERLGTVRGRSCPSAEQ